MTGTETMLREGSPDKAYICGTHSPMYLNEPHPPGNIKILI